jgi:hypothetical protein
LAGDIVIGIVSFILYRYLKKHADFRETAFYILLLTLVSSLPLISDFIQSKGDIVFHLQRIENIKVNLLSGQIPARMNYLSEGNAGIPTPVMYPELFLYIPALLRVLGIPPVFSLKLFHILLNLSCAFISYYSVSRITKSKNLGVIFSGIYTLCIYRLENIYLRHAIGEAQAMVFIPLVMLGIYEILYNDHKKWHILVIGFTGVLQSHIISTFLVVCFLILFLLFSVKHLIGGGGGGGAFFLPGKNGGGEKI